MPFIKISGLTTATAVSATNQFEINQNGGSRSATVAQVAAFARTSATDPVVLPAGTVSAPALTFTGDTNTGIYSPAADTIAFSEGGVEAMRIDSSANVGIGTSTPGARLAIQTAAGTAATQTIYTGSNAAAATLSFGQTGAVQWDTGITASSGDYRIAVNGGGTAYDIARSGTAIGYHAFSTNASERMRIDASGNVGIGTSSPAYRLDVQGGGARVYRAGADALSAVENNSTFTSYTAYVNSTGTFDVGKSNGFAFLAANGVQPLVINTNASERMRIDASGNVGIGTSSPDTRFTIQDAGTAQLSLKNTSGTTQAYIGTSSIMGSAPTNALRIRGDAGIAVGTIGQIAMFIDTSQNVGIGTSSPTERLQVNAQDGVRLGASGAVSFVRIGSAFNGESTAQISYDRSIGTTIFSQGNTGSALTERMRIDSSGNVGIGTSSPARRLDIQQSGTNYQLRIGDAGGSNFYDIGRDTSNGLLTFYGSQSVASGYVFSTVNGERMRITTAGVLQFATTAFSGGIFNISGYQDGGYYGVIMRPSGNNSTPFRFENASGTEVGTISCTTTNTNYVTSSDYRLKENVVPLTGAAARVQALKPSRFNFIADPDRTMDGFLAHEAAEVVPEAVTGEKDAVNDDGTIKAQGIDQSKLVPLLTAALQEALAEITSLKARVAILENK